MLKDLARANLVHSTRGAHGGYALARSPASITVGQVVGALEGHPALTSCEALGAHAAGDCEVEPVCPIRSPIHRLRLGIWELLERTTLLDLVRPSQPTALREAR